MKSALVQKYHTRKTILVLSTYPAKTSTHTGGGLSSYTKNTLLAIKRFSPDQKIIVLANIIDEPETYLEKDILIIRCWERGFFRFYPPVIKKIIELYKIKKFFLGFEFSAYGDVLTTSIIPLLLAFNKILGKKNISVIHQVTAHLTDLSVHTGLSRKPGSLPLYKLALNLFFRLLGLTSNKIVTLENELSERFNQIVPGQKATTIAHGLFPRSVIERDKALAQLNLDKENLYILSFGYLSHYKGSDLLVKAFQKPLTINGKKVCLILAGGESPTQGQKHHYQKFYKNLYQEIDNSQNIIHTGFVPDKRIKLFYSVADLVVFPYRAFMSASGPLALTFAHQKPFLVSSKLKNYSPYFFENNVQSIRRHILNTLKDTKKLEKLIKLSQKLSRERDFRHQGEKYLQLLNS